MKKFFFLTVTLLFTIITNAQTPPAKTWYYNNYGQKTTVKERWDEDTNGEKHGTYIMYYEDGDKKILGHFNHGKSNGLFEITIYSSFLGVSTITKTSANYQNGLLHGQYKTLKNGELYEIGNYSYGEKGGFWKEYKNGDVWSEGNYVNGVRDGKWENTFARNRTKNEIDFLLYSDPSSHVEKIVSETKKGYITTFKNGEIFSVYDDKGVDLIEKQKQDDEKQRQEDIKAEQERLNIETRKEFNYAMEMYNNGIAYRGDTTYLSAFLKKHPSANEEYVSKAKFAIKTKNDNDAFYSANVKGPVKTMLNYLNYQENFPNGIHKDEAEVMLKKEVLNYPKDLIDEIDACFTKGNYNKVITLSKLMLRYKDDIHNSFYLPATMYYSLASWSIGDKDKAIEVIKPYSSSIINYSNSNIKYMDKYWEMYKFYKEQLKINTDKETYKRIKDL